MAAQVSDDPGERGGGRLARPQPGRDQCPGQRRVAARLQRQQIRGRQAGRQRGGGLRPAVQAAVVAEQPAARGVGGSGGRAAFGAVGGRADGGQQRPGAGDPGQVSQAGIGPDRPGLPVPGGHRVAVGIPADAETVHVHGPVPLAPGRPGLPGQASGGREDQPGDGRRRPEIGEMAAHGAAQDGRPAAIGVASRAVRKPAKICRRTG
jgi:hypothetical protein